MEDFSIFITASINSETHLSVLFECLKKIRMHYISEKIFIINSDSSIDIKYLENGNNITVIKSEFNSAGESTFIYYYYHLKPSKKALYIHDSMLLLKKIDDNIIKNLETVKFLLQFDKAFKIKEQEEFIAKLNEGNEINNNDNWIGCFGCCCMITYNYLNHLQNTYNILLLTKIINKKIHREIYERVLGAIVCYDLKTTNNLSIYGDLYDYNPFEYNENKDIYKINFQR
jgi:hypothetical protein